MDPHEVVQAVEILLKEKKIDRSKLSEIIESVFRSMLKKKFEIETDEEVDQNFIITFNIDNGDVEIIHERLVVEDGEVDDPTKEIAHFEAIEIDEDVEIGEEISEIIDFKIFGRRHIIAAKQNLVQKIKQFEKQMLYDNFQTRIGEIITGTIHQITPKDIKIQYESEELLLPKSECVFNERYRRGELLRVLIKDVYKKNQDVKIVVSRSDKDFIKKLFELEVPEIADGIINITNIARKPGIRTKIVIDSIDTRVDPVGACVGQRGSRISAIVSELNKEKIDIVQFIDEPKLYLTRLLGIKTEYQLELDDENREAEIVIHDALVKDILGYKNTNIELAEDLTGYKIKVMSESEFEKENELSLETVEELGEELVALLKENDYNNAEQIFSAEKDDLLTIEGIDSEKYKFIIDTLNKYYED